MNIIIRKKETKGYTAVILISWICPSLMIAVLMSTDDNWRKSCCVLRLQSCGAFRKTVCVRYWLAVSANCRWVLWIIYWTIVTLILVAA